MGPDGYAYVGELKGFPFTPGTSRIWRVSLSAHEVTCDPAATSGPCTLYADDFTAITGLDFGPDGSLYVVSFLKNGLLADGPPVGALYRLTNGARTELAAGQLTLPGDVAVSRNGTVYVTNQSVFSGGGQVVTVGQ
jgi:sugar lactone lactonase YvrE